MLTPSQLVSLPTPIVDLFAELEADIMSDICKRIVRNKGALTASSVWQIEKLQEARGLTAQMRRDIAKAMKKSAKELPEIFREAGVRSLSQDEAVYRAAGLVSGKFAYSQALNDVLKAGIAKTNGLLVNFCGTAAENGGQALIRSLDKAYLSVISGFSSPDEAIRRSVNEIAGKGINSVAYPSGAVSSLETAVRRAVLTGANQTTAELQLTRMSELDTDLVEVTAHAGARPEHAEWQGQVYSVSGRHKYYKDFQTSTGYGDGDGLCGWNCYHSFYPYIEGFSQPTFRVDKSMSEINEEYELQQEQRALERSVRDAKKAVQAIDAARNEAKDDGLRNALNADFEKASRKLALRRQKLGNFLDQNNGLYSAPGRTFVPGFGRSIASKAAWAARR